MHKKMIALAKRLKEEQRHILMAAAETDTSPSSSTLQRVALLEQNIAAIENVLAEGE